VLGRLSEPARWEQLKTLLVHHFDPGPARGTAHAGLVRCRPGVPFPVHRHRGTETTLYLAGAVRDEDSGAIMLPGDLVTLPEGSLHRLTVLPKTECVFAVLLENDLPDFDLHE
jgi:anti-sigma factor ChrR (cupin superfamily)